MRYKLRELERIGVLELVYEPNTIRRPATYRLNISKLRERCRRTYQDVKNSRPPRRALHAVHHSSPPPQEAAASPTQLPTAAPVAVAPAPARDSHRSSSPPGISRPEERVRKLRLEVMAKWAELKRGCDKIVGLDGLAIRIGPEHPDHRPPLSSEKAWDKALSLCGITDREARERLKISLGEFEEPSP